MNEHAKMISRLDSALEENYAKQMAVWQQNSKYDQYGDLILTTAGKRRIAELVSERKQLEQSANAAYRL